MSGEAGARLRRAASAVSRLGVVIAGLAGCVPAVADSWQALGFSVKSPPVAVRDGRGRICVFARFRHGDDSRFYWARQTEPDSEVYGAWSAIHADAVPFGTGTEMNFAVGRGPHGRPTLVVNHDGFVRWTQVQDLDTRAHWDAPWSPWRRFTERLPLVGPPVVTQNADGRLAIFVLVSDAERDTFRIRMTEQINIDRLDQWFAWLDLAAGRILQFDVGRNDDGRLELFWMDGDGNHIRHRWQEAPDSRSWSGGGDLGDRFALGPVVASNDDGRLELFAFTAGSDCCTSVSHGCGPRQFRLKHRWQLTPGGAWWPPFEWGDFPGQDEEFATPLIASTVLDGGGRLHLFQPECHTIRTTQHGEGGWQEWSTLPGNDWEGCVAERMRGGRIEIFAIRPGAGSRPEDPVWDLFRLQRD
jgi:hypothetical protein